MSDREKILAAIDGFVSAYNSAELDALLSYYAEDLVKVRQGAPPESKREIAQRLRRVFDSFKTRVEVDNTEIVVRGDIAFTRGKFRVILTPRDGGELQESTRRYLEIWRKRKDVWQVTRTMDNEA